tara:strand:+ start:3913 stop:4158 length:246 start_codon:yes stop_codon:yes gene_type:complete
MAQEIKHTLANAQVNCPYTHSDTYWVVGEVINQQIKTGSLKRGQYLLGCNVCEDFYVHEIETVINQVTLDVTHYFIPIDLD